MNIVSVDGLLNYYEHCAQLNLFDQFKYDMKKTWKIISDSLNRTSHNSIPDTMVINGLECTDKKEIADSFNSFFVSIGEQNNVNVERHKESHFRDYRQS